MQGRDTMANGKTGELTIQHAMLELMLDGREWSNQDLKSRLKRKLELTPLDLSVGARTNEALWENRVNNALSPSRDSSLYSKGHVESCGHGIHRITEGGRRFITEDFTIEDLLSDILKPGKD